MMLANGTSIIFTLRDSAKVSGACERIDPFDNTKDTTGCMSLLYDTNGMGSPNMMGKDIGTINAAITTCDGVKVGSLCVDAGDVETYPADGTFVYSGNGQTYDNNWKGAIKVCSDKGMRLPTKDELATLYDNYKNGGNTVGMTDVQYYWSSNEDSEYYSWFQWFRDGTQDVDPKMAMNYVRCVK